MTRFSAAAATALSLLIGCVPSDRASDEPFYIRNRLEVIVPYGPGGGADTWARMVMPHLQRLLGSGASIQVINIPGASSVAGANVFALRRRPDGRTALVSSQIHLPRLYARRADGAV